MKPKILKATLLLSSIVAQMMFSSSVNASTEAELVKKNAPRPAKDQNWSFRLPKEDKIIYKGVVSFDQVGSGPGGMMYPAAGAAGFLAAVITHGVIAESTKNSQKTKLQQEADRVLQSYQPVLDTYTAKELMQEGLKRTTAGGDKKLVASTESPGAEWMIDSTPVYLMTQDESAIILDNFISIYVPDGPASPVYQYTVRVVSQAKEGTDFANTWTANNGEMLKAESANLYATSLDIALNQATGGATTDNVSHKTFRYLEGRAEKMERGQLISEGCGRVVMKTLRGWLMSIPARKDAAQSSSNEQCAEVVGGVK